jgi:hypothetical protein
MKNLPNMMHRWVILRCCHYLDYIQLNDRITDEFERIGKGSNHGLIEVLSQHVLNRQGKTQKPSVI